MKMTVIPVVIGSLGKTSKTRKGGLDELEIRGHCETTQTTAPLESGKIQRTLLDYCHSNSSEKSIVNADENNPQTVICIYKND